MIRIGLTRSVLAALLFMVVSVSGASAQNCNVPNNLTNGTNADATQVMANFAAILSCVNSLASPRGYLSGLTLSTAGSSASFGIAPGVATSDDTTTSMKLSTSYTKTTVAWAVGSGTGSLDTGSIANGTWYHVFLIERMDTGVVDVLISLSPTSPALPANYAKQRRIGAMKTNGSAQWVKFIQDGDNFVWDVPVQDFFAMGVGTAAVTRLLTVPTGVRVSANVAVLGESSAATGIGGIYLSDLSVADTVAGGAAFNVFVFASPNATNIDYVLGATASVMTNTSAQIRSRLQNPGGNLGISTLGWTDRRGRDS